MTTPAKQFGDWLLTAMRRAGLDVDSQMGGGRAAFAESVGVARSTVKRWLDGTTLPEPTKFEAIAETVGVPVIQMLVETGIISERSVGIEPRAEITPEQAAESLGITDPADMAAFLALAERLSNRSPAPKRDHRQRGVGGHPRPHEVKAEPGEE